MRETGEKEREWVDVYKFDLPIDITIQIFFCLIFDPIPFQNMLLIIYFFSQNIPLYFVVSFVTFVSTPFFVPHFSKEATKDTKEIYMAEGQAEAIHIVYNTNHIKNSLYWFNYDQLT